MMQAVAGEDRSMWKDGVGFFSPASPLANDAGMEVMNGPRDLAQVKRDLAAAGYNGEKFAFLVPTDLPAINAMSEVAADIFNKLGMNLDYQALDWATVAQRLLSQEPLDKGGWNLSANYAPGFSVMSPAAHSFLRGLGRQSLFGWPRMPRVEELAPRQPVPRPKGPQPPPQAPMPDILTAVADLSATRSHSANSRMFPDPCPLPARAAG
jgi:peptide/nickel transport system substrate-binding protein